MKTYLYTIQRIQKLLLVVSVIILATLPQVLAFAPEWISNDTTLRLYDISHIAVFLVMIIRPLADIFIKNPLVRPLVILRKGVGVFSAAIVVSFIFAKIIVDPVLYVSNFATLSYWSLTHYALIAHLADIAALILLITSNNFSKRILGTAWKKIQKMSYLYFYASALYVYLSYGMQSVLLSMCIITLVTYIAYLSNKKRSLAYAS